MAGLLTIQKYPTGILDFLAMRGSGDAPHELSEKLSGGVDLTPFYLADKIESIGSSTSAVNIDSYFSGGSNATTVPAGEVWIPISGKAALTTAAGTTMDLALGYFRSKGNNVFSLGQNKNIAASRPLTLIGYQWGLLTFLLPGDSFGVLAQNGTYGTPPVVSLALDFYRLKV